MPRVTALTVGTVGQFRQSAGSGRTSTVGEGVTVGVGEMVGVGDMVGVGEFVGEAVGAGVWVIVEVAARGTVWVASTGTFAGEF